MTRRQMAIAFLAGAVALTTLATTTAWAQNLEIGVAAAVNPQATGTPPAQQTRLLNVGINVFTNERIVTTEAGQTQMLFRDQSALTIGPNSDVVLDEFVYDPTEKTGKIVLRATKGLFRLVGGRISKQTPVQLKTPTATIGIRGGIAVVDVAASGATNAIFLFGDAMTVAAGGVTKAATRAGFTIQTTAQGGPPSDPTPATDAQIQGSLDGLEGSSDSAAAAGEEAPQDSDVAQSGLAAVGSSNDPDDVAPALATGSGGASEDTGAVDTGEVEETADKEEGTQNTSGGSGSPETTVTVSGTFKGRAKHATSPTTSGTDDTSSTLNVTSVDGTISGGVFSGSFGGNNFSANVDTSGSEFTASASANPFGTGTLSGTGFLTSDEHFIFYELTDQSDNHKVLVWAGQPFTGSLPSGASFYALQDDFVLDSKFALATSTLSGSLTPADSEGTADTAIVWGTGASGTTAISGTAQRTWGHRTMLISGQGTSQKSVIVVAGGEVQVDSSSRPFLGGGMGAMSRLGTSAIPIHTNGEVSSADDGSGNDFFGSSSPDYFVVEAADVDTSDSILSRGLVEDAAIGITETTYYPNAVALPASDTLSRRSSRDLHGYTGGALQKESSPGTLASTVAFRNLNSDPDDVDIHTSIETNKMQASIDVIDAFGSTFNSLKLDFGDHDVSAFPDDTTTSSGESAFIDDFNFGGGLETGTSTQAVDFTVSSVAQTVSNEEFFIVTADESQLSGNGFLPSGVSFCGCQYLVWGFWGGFFDLSDSSSRMVHLGNWVAGEMATHSAISALTGSATYTGHAIGTVIAGSSSPNVYQAVGEWSYTMNFSSPSSSTGHLDSFDGSDYTLGGATLAASTLSLNTFSGSISGDSNSGSFKGSFMKSSSDDAAEMGGHFQLSGTDYKASGIFTAKK